MGLALPYNRLQITVVRMFMGQQKSINFFLARDYCSCPMALLGYIFSSKTIAKRLEEKHSKKRAKRANLYYITPIQLLQNVHNEKQLLKNWVRGNRKTLKRPKMKSKIKFRNLKLKSHEEYLICRIYFGL